MTDTTDLNMVKLLEDEECSGRPAALRNNENLGVVACELVPAGRTMNSGFYIEVLKRLRDAVQ